MGADLIEHATGEFSRAVYVKGGSGDPSMYVGTVDIVTGAPAFAATELAGHGDDYFSSWYVYVVWDNGGTAAAPQGESQAITAYTSSSGIFSHAAFTTPLAIGDKVLISLTDPTAIGDATEAKQDTIISGQEGGVNDVNRAIGKTQVKTISVTAAADAVADTTLGTVTTHGCIIQGIVIHADAAQTVDLTSCPVHGGAAKVLTFIAAADAIQANLNAENKQIGWDGEVYLPTGSTIVMVHNGGGATALDLTVTIRYAASVNGGYLA